MRPKDYALPVIVVFLVYIAYGSAIPGPLGSFSQTLRSGANHFFSSIFSSFATYNPYNRSEKAVQELQKNK
ncbi:hypothetical protein RIF25_05895 [Thermosynechococcaceae cyanobacterium BACA0444]|uniref:Uncharacterized protein n=1 Tax=Pseudocalidococcus azoricus BACA0444 TaxID=2918990 RepID=A0AAE4JVR4_9CYAN|nr:hypothetical protein [Pseudocalidococcus azoricus]MDS3860336.1 hypothetical protein [Pseudocalidococcus azoricus BACA0444]